MKTVKNINQMNKMKVKIQSKVNYDNYDINNILDLISNNYSLLHSKIKSL